MRALAEGMLDPGSFGEIDTFVTQRTVGLSIGERKILGDSVVTGWGKINGRLVSLLSQDFTVFGGRLGEVYAEKV